MHVESNALKQFIRSLGFDRVGFTRIKVLDEEARRLEKWLNQGYQGEMSYLERYFDLRIDPARLVPGAKSMIVLTMNYDQAVPESHPERPNVSRYALGEDYHRVIRRKTKEILRWMRQQFGEVTARAFVDSGPVLERVWAREAGLAWSGKNTLSIHPRSGSYFFLACILTDLEFDYDLPIRDHCGTCRKCIEACPTDAFSPQGYVLDASRCISYLTIELRGRIPDSFSGQMKNWIFGCDICQQVCPWNRFSEPTRIPELQDSGTVTGKSFSDWMDLGIAEFEAEFRHSPLKRTGLEGIQRNVRFVLESGSKDPT
ncbi:MAG TPA: tRNA epoxyqueuosine(34) reductase QueG [Saprospiraceae bacterium]|nr:tRNA epoxyqueuosine(34) reductase QueG [Saprospiraceae bacterium]